MASNVSLEDLLKKQVAKLNELKMATMLLGHKSALSEQLSEAKLEVELIQTGIDAMRQDLRIMKEQNARSRNLSTLLTELVTKIVHMGENLPEQFVRELTSLHEQASPMIENTEDSEKRVEASEKQNDRHVTYSNFDTPGQNINDCKKTLFANPEDSYSMELLNKEEFSNIPKYMIGRQSLASLNDFITIINGILETKYGLLALGKNGARKKGKLDLYLSLKRDEIVVGPGEDPIYFFTAEDYLRHTQSKLDKSKLNLLMVLRHCKRLRELRVGKSLKYVLIPA